MQFLNLPFEIRLNIYDQLFGEDTAFINSGRQDTGLEAELPSLLPCSIPGPYGRGRSGQVLRTCKEILAESRPVLYQGTLFNSVAHAFAGRLPITFVNSNPSFAHVRHLRWQLECDLLKNYEVAAVKIDEGDVRGLESIELVCQAESWKKSVCSAWIDCDAFNQGRQQVLDFAILLQSKMNSTSKPVTLLEDTTHISRGRIILKLIKGRYNLGAKVRISHP